VLLFVIHFAATAATTAPSASSEDQQTVNSILIYFPACLFLHRADVRKCGRRKTGENNAKITRNNAKSGVFQM